MERPLSGVLVVELSMAVAGPSCGKALYELGADVIKIELRDKGEVWRYTPVIYSVPTDAKENPLYESLNSGKKHVELKLSEPGDKERFLKLIEKADVFLTNYRVSTLESMGYDYESLKKINKKLIYAIITAYGSKGPRAGEPGYDGTTFWAESGFLLDMSTLGKNNEPGLPVSSPTGGGDITTGAWLTGGICAALYRREKSGEGSYVTCPLYGTGIWTFSQLGICTQYGYQLPHSFYQFLPVGCPYMTADGDYIMINILKYDEQWPQFCYVYDMEDLIDHPVYSHKLKTIDPVERQKCVETISQRAAKCSTEDVLRRLKEVDLVYCKMNHMKDVYSNQQAIENGDIVPFTYESGKQIYLPKPPVRVNGMEARPHTVCGPVGQDNEEIFEKYGLL